MTFNNYSLKGILVLAFFGLSCAPVPRVVRLKIPAGLTEAPQAFDLSTNGFQDQATMNDDAAQFEQSAAPGVLGPHFNSLACVDCHLNPTTGGASAVFEHRIGPDDPHDQIAAAALIHDGAVDPNQQQRAPLDAINVLRRTLNLFGDAFVEQVPDTELAQLSDNGGFYIKVPILERGGQSAIGRFGWKDQHASLLSFAGDAAFNEMGEGNRLVPDPTAGNGGIEDNDNPTPTRPEDIDNYAGFMRSLKAPSRGPITAQVTHGQVVFERTGCVACHVETLYTPKYVFHPFGDYLLHDIGTGDGIAQAGAPANRLRTVPLWGLRTVTRFLHDGRAFDVPTAILAHRGEAVNVTKRYKGLSQADKADLLAFLLSL